MEDLQFDKRLIKRFLRKGTLDKKQVDKHLAALRDASENVIPFDVVRDDETSEKSQDKTSE